MLAGCMGIRTGARRLWALVSPKHQGARQPESSFPSSPLSIGPYGRSSHLRHEHGARRGSAPPPLPTTTAVRMGQPWESLGIVPARNGTLTDSDGCFGSALNLFRCRAFPRKVSDGTRTRDRVEHTVRYPAVPARSGEYPPQRGFRGFCRGYFGGFRGCSATTCCHLRCRPGPAAVKLARRCGGAARCHRRDRARGPVRPSSISGGSVRNTVVFKREQHARQVPPGAEGRTPYGLCGVLRTGSDPMARRHALPAGWKAWTKLDASE